MFPHIGIHDFRWIPGSSIGAVKLARMQMSFPKPDKLPPVAWFMSGIEYHKSVKYYRDWSDSQINLYLERTGITTFGRLKIWVDWFHHMLPSFIKKASTSDDALFFDIIGYFYELYPYEIFEEYFGFRHDVFHTLMKVIMQDRFWKNGDLKIPDWAEESDEYNPEWYEQDVGGQLYDSLEFCIKYLPERDLVQWVESVARIDGKIWRTQVRFWIDQFKQTTSEYPIPEKRAKLFFDELRQHPGYEDV